MIFKKGEAIFYPGHGQGVVANVEKKELFGRIQKFLTVKIDGDFGLKIMLPADTAKRVGLRKL